jgi:hypothetical protein
VNLELSVFPSPVNILEHMKVIAIFEKSIDKDVPDLICDTEYFNRYFLSLFRILFVAM